MKDSGKLLLVEEPSIPMINHNNGVAMVILNQSRGYTPVIISKSDVDLPFFQSYVPSARIIRPIRLSLVRRLFLAAKAVLQWLMIKMTRNVVGFSHGGVRYGDIAYDTYLAQQKVGTIRHIDKPLLWIFYNCMRRHDETRALIKSGKFSAVLVSHAVDTRSGVMLRSAIGAGCEGYLRAGHHQLTLQRHRTSDDVYDYAYTPRSRDIDTLVTELGERLPEEFKKELDFQISGKGSTDSMYAFNPSLKFYAARDKFCADYKVDPAKKNIFVMLHALNDYPHSHFRWMLFRDYYDWFYQTLQFAKKHPEVNWIFKQHPSIKFYPITDVNFDELFVGVPPNIVYISPEKQIDTRSVISISECVITCLGSAGFEVPAMGGVPSIVAGDNFYFGLGFAREPRTKEQYYQILSGLADITPLTPEQHRRAQATYLYIYRYARAPFSGAPVLSFSDEKDPKMADWYWDRVAKLYVERGEKIRMEMREYAKETAKPDFVKLPNLDFSLHSPLFSDAQ